MTRLREELLEWKKENFNLFCFVVYAITHSKAEDILYAYNYALRKIYLRTCRQLPYWNATLTSILPYRSSSQLHRHFLSLMLKKEWFPRFTMKCLMDKKLLEKTLMAWLVVDEGVYGRSLLAHVMLMSSMDSLGKLFGGKKVKFQEEALHNGTLLGYGRDFWMGDIFRKTLLVEKERIEHLCMYEVTKP